MKRELTNQELLDRYIHAVKMMLPREKMEDILRARSRNPVKYPG